MSTVFTNVNFNVDVKGDESGLDYVGSFTTKTTVSQREKLQQDELRRTILGPNGQDASQEAQLVAHTISFLKVRLVKSPSWWEKDLKGGLDCVDDNVLSAVFTACLKAIDDYRASIIKQGEDAKQDLENLTKSIP